MKKMRQPTGGRHHPAHPHLHRPKMSVTGKSAYAGGAASAIPAFPPAPAPGGAAPAFPSPDMGAPGNAAPAMAPGGPGGLGGM